MAQAAAIKAILQDSQDSPPEGSLALSIEQGLEIPDRYELKYFVTEEQAAWVRQAILPHCTLDPNSASSPNHQYVIRSLYLDTPGRDLYRISRQCRVNRWKIRVRRYGDGEASSPMVFLEVKNKLQSMIKKSRAKIPAEGWADRIRGELAASAGREEKIFWEKLLRFPLNPMLMVRYEREAWISHVDSYARVTFDRRVACQPWAEWSFDCGNQSWLSLDSRRALKTVPQGVVLELKCLSAVPHWLSDLTRSLGLMRTSYSKYCQGVERLWERDTLLGLLHNCT